MHVSDDLDRLVTMWPGLFSKRPSRKRRFLDYLRSFLPAHMVKMAPLPREQRWRTWYEAAVHHLDYLHVYEGFLKQEGDAPNTQKLLEICSSPGRMQEVRAAITFVKEHCAVVMQTLTQFESRTRCQPIFFPARLITCHRTAGFRCLYHPHEDEIAPGLNQFG